MFRSSTALLSFCALFAASFLTGCGAPQRPPGESATPKAAQPAPGLPADSAAYAFDVPALLGLTADQIRATLGKPLKDQQGDVTNTLRDFVYKAKGYELYIGYEAQSRRVISFYIPVAKPTKEYKYLLEVGRVNYQDKRYKVEPFEREGGLYAGLSITPDSTAQPTRH